MSFFNANKPVRMSQTGMIQLSNQTNLKKMLMISRHRQSQRSRETQRLDANCCTRIRPYLEPHKPTDLGNVANVNGSAKERMSWSKLLFSC